MNHPFLLPCRWCGACGCSGSCAAPTVAETFYATIGRDPVLWEADTLDALLAYLRGIHEPGRGESIAIWQGAGTLVAVLLFDGSLLEIVGTTAGRASR
jgi:hypothetical protein